MKTKTLKKNKVNVITLGCSKNTFDSEVLMAQLNANKFDVEHESTSDDAEIVIINTCGFIDNAKQESIDMIIQYVDAKAEGLVEKVFVTGCLSERYRADLEGEFPEVDAFFGTRELPRLLKTLKANTLLQIPLPDTKVKVNKSVSLLFPNTKPLASPVPNILPPEIANVKSLPQLKSVNVRPT